MKKRVLLRCVCVLSLVAVLLSCITLPAGAAMSKQVKKRVIGVVFDNSGSMYLKDNTAWSQAQYAMEVFASMINDGDEFIIYPMHPINIGTNGQQYTANNPYIVKDAASANTIRNIYSPSAGGTPGKKTTQIALEDLKNKTGEKWLIILTDGEFEDANLTQQGTLINDCLNYVNVLYLAMSSKDTKLKVPSVKSSENYTYSGVVAESSDKVPAMLTQMCNKVFGRDELPAEYMTDNKFTIDIPMSKVYVFVQGKSISNVQLSGNGTSYKATKVLNPCYGTNGGYATYDKKVYQKYDSSLQGCLTVFENLCACKNGEEYSIKFNGQKSDVSIYYEPDVNLVVQMVNPDGMECMDDQIFTIGDYSLRYYLADKDGQELNSKLLGKTDFELKYTIDGEEKVVQKNSVGEIPIHLDENTTFSVNTVSAVILSGYSIEKSGDELGFLSKGIKGEKGAAGTLKMTLTGGKDNYDPDVISNDAKYKATFTYDGEPITGEALNNLKFNCQVQNSTIKASVTKEEDGFAIVLEITGSLADVTPGKYILNCSSTYTTSESKDAYVRSDVEFKINDISGKLSAKIDINKSYFVKKDLANEKLLLRLSLNGKPLDDEQLKNVKIEADSLPITTRMLPGQSAYEILFDTKSPIDTGEYDLTIKASNVKDRLGNSLVAEDSMTLTIGVIARWIKILLWLLGIGAFFALLWYICTRLALPKKFEEVPCKINYLGKTKTGVAECMVNGNRKKKTINYSCSLDKTQTTDITFTVVPDKKSYWIKPSAKRKAMIIPQETLANYNVSEVKPYGGTKIPFDKGEIPQKALEKLMDNTSEDFDCDGKFHFSGQTNKGRFDIDFTPEIK